MKYEVTYTLKKTYWVEDEVELLQQVEDTERYENLSDYFSVVARNVSGDVKMLRFRVESLEDGDEIFHTEWIDLIQNEAIQK